MEGFTIRFYALQQHEHCDCVGLYSVNLLGQISQKKPFFVSVHFHLSVSSCRGEFPFPVPLYVWLPGARCQVEESSPFKFHYMSGCQVLVPRPIHLLLEVTFSSQMGTLSTRCWCCGQSIFTSGLENGQFRVPDPPVAISVGGTSLKILSVL